MCHLLVMILGKEQFKWIIQIVSVAHIKIDIFKKHNCLWKVFFPFFLIPDRKHGSMRQVDNDIGVHAHSEPKVGFRQSLLCDSSWHDPNILLLHQRVFQYLVGKQGHVYVVKWLSSVRCSII